MMNNNNQFTYNRQFPVSQYEVHQPTFQHSGPVNALPHMPGFTPVLMNVPYFPQESAHFAPMQMQAFNPFFLQAQPNVLPPSNSISPVLLPMPVHCNFPNNVPSLSPPLQMPFLNLQQIPPPMVSVSSPPQMSQSAPPSKAANSYLAAASGLMVVPDRSRSRSASIASESDSGEVEMRNRSVSREMEAPSKRALVDQTLGWMESVFGDRYDNDGTRGENVLRLKVKTVIALEHIVDFISRCNNEGLIHSISCPVSTKKGRQHVRGYLAYIKGFSGASADRIEAIFEEFNKEKGYPFKTLHCNPVSTL